MADGKEVEKPATPTPQVIIPEIPLKNNGSVDYAKARKAIKRKPEGHWENPFIDKNGKIIGGTWVND